MDIHGFYVIREQYFVDFPDPYLKGNKQEGRPHYLAILDKRTGLYWMIPMSSRIEKYKKIESMRLAQNKPCDFIHIAKGIGNRESVFLLGDMFPIIEAYVLRPYTIANIPQILRNEKEVARIEKKAKKILSLLHRKIKFTPTQPDVLTIENRLLCMRKKAAKQAGLEE